MASRKSVSPSRKSPSRSVESHAQMLNRKVSETKRAVKEIVNIAFAAGKKAEGKPFEVMFNGSPLTVNKEEINRMVSSVNYMIAQLPKHAKTKRPKSYKASYVVKELSSWYLSQLQKINPDLANYTKEFLNSDGELRLSRNNFVNLNNAIYYNLIANRQPKTTMVKNRTVSSFDASDVFQDLPQRIDVDPRNFSYLGFSKILTTKFIYPDNDEIDERQSELDKTNFSDFDQRVMTYYADLKEKIKASKVSQPRKTSKK